MASRLPDGGDPLERALGVAFALVGFVVAAGVMTDNSLLTHIATGRVILDTGSVPSVDPYSRFGAGASWTVQSWLVSVVYAALDRAIGPEAIRLFHGVVGGAIGVGLWHLSRPATQVSTRVALTALPLAVGAGLWSPRPLLVGLLALVVLLLIVTGRRAPWLLVPLLWVWGNAHGSYPLALVYLGAVVVGSWLDGRRVPSAELRYLRWGLLGTVAAAIGPLGVDLLTFPVRVIAAREAMTGVVEWEAPSYGSPSELVWLVAAGAALVAARRGARWRDLVPVVVFAVAGFLALRNLAPAVVVVAASVAPALARTEPRPAPATAGATPRTGDGPRRPSELRAGLARAIGVAGAVALTAAVAAVVVTPALDLDRYPADAVDAMEAAGLVPADEVVVVHREAIGNYLTWRYGTDALVFVDDRFDFHDEELLADHRDLLAGRDPGRILDGRSADVVLWESDAALAAWLEASPEWAVVADAEWTVACRRSSPVASGCSGVTLAPPPELVAVDGSS
ncbi:MAG: hypothetical protein AAGA93_01590 [Actinomycetota bacterium]